METGLLARRLVVALILAASTVLGGSLWSDDRSTGPSSPARPSEVKHGRPLSRSARDPSFRPEFSAAAVTRGEADEPGIAKLDADWSHGLELRAIVDRTEFRQLQRIRVVTRVKNVSDRRWFWHVGCCMVDRYLGVRIRVFDTNGKLMPMTEYYKHEAREHTPYFGGMGGGGGNFKPGDTSRTDVIANLIFDMTRPGEYWILVEEEWGQQVPPPPKDEELFYVRAKPIKVRVTSEVLSILPDGSSVANPDRP